jgi:hypothetical protein
VVVVAFLAVAVVAEALAQEEPLATLVEMAGQALTTAALFLVAEAERLATLATAGMAALFQRLGPVALAVVVAVVAVHLTARLVAAAWDCLVKDQTARVRHLMLVRALAAVAALVELRHRATRVMALRQITQLRLAAALAETVTPPPH